jgi:hypothetical protein
VCLVSLPQPPKRNLQLPERCFGTQAPKELRSTFRYALRAKVVFTWLDGLGHPHYGRGCTCDISPRGIYVIASGGPPTGTSVDISIYLPALLDESRLIRMEAEGLVVRVEPGEAESSMGFSIQSQRMALCAN